MGVVTPNNKVKSQPQPIAESQPQPIAESQPQPIAESQPQPSKEKKVLWPRYCNGVISRELKRIAMPIEEMRRDWRTRLS